MRNSNLDKLVELKTKAAYNFTLKALTEAPTLSLKQTSNYVGEIFNMGNKEVVASVERAYGDFKKRMRDVVAAAKNMAGSDNDMFLHILLKATNLKIHAALDLAESAYDITYNRLAGSVSLNKEIIKREASLKKYSWDILDPMWDIIEKEGCKQLVKKKK